MRVCFISEGCYPYVMGGVSGWIHSMICAFPEHEFSILAIITDRSISGKFIYSLPDNVVEIREIYLNDMDWGHGVPKVDKLRKKTLSKETNDAIRALVLDAQVNWDKVFDYFSKENISLNEVLMGVDFFQMVKELYGKDYFGIVFTDFLWTIRSIYLPMFQVLNSEIPRADIYHCVSTGYAGLVGCMGQYLFGGALIISEHGIYTREREEEIIRADWVKGVYKDIWIRQFRKMAKLAYDRAFAVVSLFDHYRELQIELGCPPEKAHVIPNGITPFDFPPSRDADGAEINMGAIVRLVPIKDIKTLIQAFADAKRRIPQLKLWIMGPDAEDQEYAKECYDLVSYLQLEDVVFTGRVDVKEYLPRMSFTILTSISEGQPLVILESFAAHKPVIATDVGNCRGLLYGEPGDDLGEAGIITHIMNVKEISTAMMEMALNPEKTKKMGDVGFRRLHARYLTQYMKDAYSRLYTQAAERKERHGGNRNQTDPDLSA